MGVTPQAHINKEYKLVKTLSASKLYFSFFIGWVGQSVTGSNPDYAGYFLSGFYPQCKNISLILFSSSAILS